MEQIVPDVTLYWELKLTDKLLKDFGGDPVRGVEDRVETVLRPALTDALEGLPVDAVQQVWLADAPTLPFRYAFSDGQLTVKTGRHEATLKMGEKAFLPFPVKPRGWFWEPELRLMVKWPEQAAGPRPLSEVARRLATGRDWHAFVLRQCRYWAKNVGHVREAEPGVLILKVGRNGNAAEETYKTYEIADFIDSIEADLAADAAALADVTSIVVETEVHFYNGPTDWEHDCLGIPWEEDLKRTRTGETKVLYEVMRD